MKTSASSPEIVDLFEIYLDTSPGHYFRRLQQVTTAIFVEKTAGFGVTPVQYVALLAIGSAPGIDQRAMARKAGLDFATAAGVMQRLEKRGLIERGVSERDRRVRLLFLTEAGEELLKRVQSAVATSREQVLLPLPPEERVLLMKLLRRLCECYDNVDVSDDALELSVGEGR